MYKLLIIMAAIVTGCMDSTVSSKKTPTKQTNHQTLSGEFPQRAHRPEELASLGK